jgi:hypothetical protein
MANVTEKQQETESKKHYRESPACLQHWSLPERTCFSPQSVYRRALHPGRLLTAASQTVDLLLLPVETIKPRKGSVKQMTGSAIFSIRSISQMGACGRGQISCYRTVIAFWGHRERSYVVNVLSMNGAGGGNWTERLPVHFKWLAAA